MTPYEWPASLPCFRFEPYAVSPRDGALQLDIGQLTHRARVYSQTGDVVSAEVVLIGSLETTFRNFYKTTLAMGTQSFTVPIWIKSGFETREVLFVGPPPAFTPIADGVVRTSFSLIIRPNIDDPVYELIATYLPDFDAANAAIDPDDSIDTFTLTGLFSSDKLIITLPNGRLYKSWSRWTGYGTDPGENPDLGAPLWFCRFSIKKASGSQADYFTISDFTEAAALASNQAIEPIEVSGSISYKFWLRDDILFNRGGLSPKIEHYRLA